MITIDDNIKEDDITYCWFSYINEKKKPKEHEFKVMINKKECFKVHSIDGDYDLIFNEELLKRMYGNCRKT